MATNYQYRSLEVTNFRSFNKISIPNLRRINIFGGFNGAGKSSLLEILFFTMDVLTPVAVLKPYLFRNVAARDEDDLFFLLKDRASDAVILTNGSRGPVRTTISRKSTPSEAIAAINSSLKTISGDIRSSETYGETGLQVDSSWGQRNIRCFVFPYSEGYSANVLSANDPQIPTAVFIGNGARANPQESATRLSRLIKGKKLDSLILPLRLFQPRLKGFTILQSGSDQLIYADIDGELCSINMLGDGFRNLFDVILAISVSQNGCVFLDEIDASFHYTIVSDAWKIISNAAADENCQIFATSHSRETILSAANGVSAAGREDDFSYFRLSSSKDRHIVTSYNVSEVAAADEFNIELR